MKMMKQITITILFLISCCFITFAQEQDLTKMPEIQRNAFLISIAREVVLLYGPDYYREVAEPIVERREQRAGYGNFFYFVAFPFDPAQERLGRYAAEVRFRDDGHPLDVMFGNGYGLDTSEDWRQGPPAHVGVIRYQDLTKPKYYNDGEIQINIPSHIDKDSVARAAYIQRELLKYDFEPLNKDELLQRGWEKNSEGKWVKVREPLPPPKRVNNPK